MSGAGAGAGAELPTDALSGSSRIDAVADRAKAMVAAIRAKKAAAAAAPNKEMIMDDIPVTKHPLAVRKLNAEIEKLIAQRVPQIAGLKGEYMRQAEKRKKDSAAADVAAAADAAAAALRLYDRRF